jgi:hypothetical protein
MNNFKNDDGEPVSAQNNQLLAPSSDFDLREDKKSKDFGNKNLTRRAFEAQSGKSEEGVNQDDV